MATSTTSTKAGAAVALIPLGDRVAVRPRKADEKVGGLYLPQQAITAPQVGEVVAVGSGRTEAGLLVPMRVRVGDVVAYAHHARTELVVNGETLYLFHEPELLAVLHSEAEGPNFGTTK